MYTHIDHQTIFTQGAYGDLVFNSIYQTAKLCNVSNPLTADALKK